MVDVTSAGVVLILLGFAVVLLSIIPSARKTRGEVKGGGVVMIGPIPIVFGSDAKWASIAIVLAIVLMVISILLFTV